MECSSCFRGGFFFFIHVILGLVFVLLSSEVRGAQRFRVATFNVENYLLSPVSGRPLKSDAARKQVRETLIAMEADVVALQEMGGAAALEELRSALARDGLKYPYREIIAGHDTNIFVALLSRFPVISVRGHTNDSFLLSGKRHFVSRGFLEAELQVGDRYRFTLFAAHLKSRRPVPEADEAELREQEAKLLRERIDARLTNDPKANLVVLGDLNDTKDSRSIRALMGRGNKALIDTRPAEMAEVDAGSDTEEGTGRRTINWTHYYAKEDSYSRIDYILISRGMYHEWDRAGTKVVARPGWGVASDHRPVMATFVADDHGQGP